METGLEQCIWKKIAKEAKLEGMPDTVHIRPNSRCFHVSRIPNTKNPKPEIDGNHYPLQNPARSLKTIVLNELHKAPFNITARRTDISEISEVDRNKHPLHPTDLLIIGLLPKGKDLKESTPLITDMIPLIGVECRARDPFSNISVLALYSEQQIQTNLKGWIELLEVKSNPLSD
jgi:hypothetical protein